MSTGTREPVLKPDAYRREILFRRLEGKQIINKFRLQIEAITNSDFEESKKLSLEDSDRLIDSRMTLLYTLEFPSFATCLDELHLENGGSACYLLLSEGWKACGAYLTNPHHLNKDFSFQANDAHAIRLIYPEWQHEVWIDLFADRKGDYFEYRKYKRSSSAPC